MRPTIALCCIMRNEAHNLTPMLQSVRGCFDEIHLTDTGSTDNTLSFVDKINDKIDMKDPEWEGIPRIRVHHFDWVHDFAKARNYSISHTRADFFMWLDLDDRLSDRAAFIHWRDHVMHTAHYWMATYNYHFDKNGNPDMVFTRERVLRNNFGFYCKSFLHEGFVMKDPAKQYWPNRVNTWTVNHDRPDRDGWEFKRNLEIYDSKPVEEYDARLKFYRGKELLENARPLEASPWLMDALRDDALELHDRIMCIQFAATAAKTCGAIEEARKLCFQGIRLLAQKPEYWLILGDIAKESGNLADAILYYDAALKCSNHGGGGFLVTTHFANNEWPLSSLVKCFIDLCNADRAKEYNERLRAFNPEMAHENDFLISRMSKLSHVPKDQKKTQDIIISCMPGGVTSDWDEGELATKGLGGSETACVEIARLLREKTGRDVIVYNSRSAPKLEKSGVRYIPNQFIHEYFLHKEPRVHIHWRHACRLTNGPSYIWSHDLVTPMGERLDQYDKYICLSEFHKNYVKEMQLVPDDKITVIGNGINPEHFKDKGSFAKNPLKVLFPGSPDRGLDRVIQIVRRAREMAGIEFEMHCFYGFRNMRLMGLNEMADKLEAMIRENPWVRYHGFVGKKELYGHMFESAFWLYPANFIETYCITAIECLAAGVFPIVRSMGALPYTLGDAVANNRALLLSRDCDTEEEIDFWAKALVDSHRDRAWERVNYDPNEFSWSKIADQMIKEFGL